MSGGLECGPDEAGQLAGDGYRDLWAWLASLRQASEASMESGHGPVGDGDHPCRLTVPPGGQAADAGSMSIVPGGFDEEPADMAVAGFGDGSALLPAARGVLAGHQAQEGHETPSGLEAHETVQLATRLMAVTVSTPRKQRKAPTA